MRLPLISNIQRFSLDDGPGIRTTVFFKGCNLSCIWCHNPECISKKSSLQFFQDQCTGCGHCEMICPDNVHHISPDSGHLINRDACNSCGKCIEECLSNALQLNGTIYTTHQLFQELRKDLAFYKQSGGGVTFSGGEPLLHHEFLKEMLILCKNANINTAVDTAGNVPFARYEEILPYTDYLLYDIKAFSEKLHIKCTGVSNKLIKDNLQKLSNKDISLIIRVPIISGANDDFQELSQIAEFLTDINILKIELLPYHTYGIGKYSTFGIIPYASQLEVPTDEFMQSVMSMFKGKRLNVSL